MRRLLPVSFVLALLGCRQPRLTVLVGACDAGPADLRVPDLDAAEEVSLSNGPDELEVLLCGGEVAGGNPRLYAPDRIDVRGVGGAVKAPEEGLRVQLTTARAEVSDLVVDGDLVLSGEDDCFPCLDADTPSLAVASVEVRGDAWLGDSLEVEEEPELYPSVNPFLLEVAGLHADGALFLRGTAVRVSETVALGEVRAGACELELPGGVASCGLRARGYNSADREACSAVVDVAPLEGCAPGSVSLVDFGTVTLGGVGTFTSLALSKVETADVSGLTIAGAGTGSATWFESLGTVTLTGLAVTAEATALRAESVERLVLAGSALSSSGAYGLDVQWPSAGSGSVAADGATVLGGAGDLHFETDRAELETRQTAALGDDWECTWAAGALSCE